MRRKLERERYEQAAWRAMEGEVPEPVDDTQVRTDEYPQPEAQRADDRGDRFSRAQGIMLRKLERERHEKDAWCAALLPMEAEVPEPTDDTQARWPSKTHSTWWLLAHGCHPHPCWPGRHRPQLHVPLPPPQPLLLRLLLHPLPLPWLPLPWLVAPLPLQPPPPLPRVTPQPPQLLLLLLSRPSPTAG
jgi:hypothetical protein